MKPKNVQIVSMSFLDLLSCTALGGTMLLFLVFTVLQKGRYETHCALAICIESREEINKGASAHEIWISGVLAASGRMASDTRTTGIAYCDGC